MQLPRFRIATVMVFVALVALDLGAIRVLRGVQFRAAINGSPRLAEMMGALILGALPMANVLAFGFLIGLRRRDSSPFFLGFEAFGVTALALYIAGASLFTEELITPVFDLVREHLFKPLLNGPYLTMAGLLIPNTVAIVMLVLPQLALALIGGFLFRQCRTL